MARFRGLLKGSQGETTRLGTAASGLTVHAESWMGDVIVRMWDANGIDKVEIMVRQHGATREQSLFHGKVSELLSPKGHAAIVRTFAEAELRKEYGNA